MVHVSRWSGFGLTILVIVGAPVSCGGASGPAILQGPLAFPVANVIVSKAPLIGEGTPDAGWPAIDLALLSACFLTSGPVQTTKVIEIEIWNPDGGELVTGTWSFIDPNADPSFGSATLVDRTLLAPGVGGSVTLTEAGPVYIGSFSTSVNEQTLSGSFSTAVPSECADP